MPDWWPVTATCRVQVVAAKRRGVKLGFFRWSGMVVGKPATLKTGATHGIARGSDLSIFFSYIYVFFQDFEEGCSRGGGRRKDNLPIRQRMDRLHVLPPNECVFLASFWSCNEGGI